MKNKGNKPGRSWPTPIRNDILFMEGFLWLVIGIESGKIITKNQDERQNEHFSIAGF